MNFLERKIKSAMQSLGILVRHYGPASSEDARRILLFKHYGVDLVLDVGANSGQYGLSLFDNGYSGKIISFEPLSAAHKLLTDNAAGNDRWTIIPRCAVGSSESELTINISQNSFSSSLLPMLDSHVKDEPLSAFIASEKVMVYPLDHLALEHITKSKSLFVKIDVEGFEQEVIKGAKSTLAKAKGVELEISVVPLYEGQSWLLQDVLKDMSAMGFNLKSINPAFTNRKTGEVLQCNGIFYRD